MKRYDAPIDNETKYLVDRYMLNKNVEWERTRENYIKIYMKMREEFREKHELRYV